MTDTVFTIEDALNAVWKYRKRVLLFGILTPLLVLTITLLSPKHYTSTAKLFVRLGRENASLDATATLGESPVVAMPLSREAEINSIAEMMQNKTLFEEVVDLIGVERILENTPAPQDPASPESVDQKLANEKSDTSSSPGIVDRLMGSLASVGIVNSLPRREKAIIELQKSLSISPMDNSNVLQVSYESKDPKLSQDVVSCLTENYLKTHAAIHRSKGAVEFLDEQTERLRTSLAADEDQFKDLKNDSGVIDIEGQRRVLVDRYAKIAEAKLTVDADLEALETEIDKIESLMSEVNPEVVIEETVGVGNEGIDGMRQELYRLEVQREQLLGNFFETHPRVTAIDAQIRNSKAILDEAEKERKESKRGPNEVYQRLEFELNAKTPQLFAMQTKSAAFANQLEAVKKEKEAFAELETQYVRLERSIALGDINYRKYVNNLEQARMDSLLQSQNLSNISIAQPASFEPKPSSPNKLMNLILGFVFGAFIGIGSAVYRGFKDVRSANQRSESTTENLATSRPDSAAIPVIGELPALSNSPTPNPAEAVHSEHEVSADGESEPGTQNS